MKNVFKKVYKNTTKILATYKTIIITAIFVVLMVGGVVLGVSSCSKSSEPVDTASKSDVSTSSEPSVSSEDKISDEMASDNSSEASEDVSSKPSEEKGESSSKKDTSSKKPSSSKPSNNSSKKPSSSSSQKPSSSTSSKKPSGGTTTQKDYIDTSKLTYTKKDVGKVVGYDSTIKEEVVVEKVKEGVNGTGHKYIRVVLSNGDTKSIVECEYCHEMPCPNGGGKKCLEYNVKEDATVTCQQCGKPKGDGHNGTCDRTIDWNNGGKIICHHYD